MMGKSTRHLTTRLWTGIITLLVLNGSASSQGVTALNEAASSLRLENIAESISGSVEPLRKVDTIVEVPSTTLKYVGEVPEASVEGNIGDKLLDSFTIKSNDFQNVQILSDSKSEKLRIQEPLTNVARIEEKRAGNGSLPEFSENEDNGELDDLESDNDREPTTPPSEKEVDEENAAPTNPKHKGKERGAEKPEEKIPELGISLANDTNVNYNRKKPFKVSKDEEALNNDFNSIKNILENATNVKAQVEVVKNLTLPKVLRFSEAGADEEGKEVESLGSAKQESVIVTSENTVISESKDLTNAREKTSNLTMASGADVDDEKTNDTKVLQASPKGRTISFSGINEFITTDNKTGGATRDNGEITDRPNNQIMTEITKESDKEQKSTDFKPYPYAKTGYQSNSSEVSSTGDGQVSESTEEASALENTIGQRQQDKKFVIAEPSVVIDNSIQQFKPTYYKRSGNSSRISTSSDSTMSPTASSLEGEEKSEMTLSTKPIALENDTTVFVASLSVSNTENDVPRDKDEAAKSSVGAKDTSSSLDLSGNGITEVIAGVKNDSVRIDEDSVTATSISLTTSSIFTPRATENTLVQISTEKITTISEDVALTNIDVQTDPEESLQKISSFNVTEGSTRIASNQRATNVATSTPTILMSTLIPVSSSKFNPTPDISSTLTLNTSEKLSLSTLTPESSLISTTSPESSSVLPTAAETSTMSTTVSSFSSLWSPSSMASSVSASIPMTSSVMLKATSASLLSTELEVQTTAVAPVETTDSLPPNTFKAGVSSNPNDPVESTTSKIEYVFVGLTESTTSQQHIAASESLNAMTLEGELSSATPSIITESSALTSTIAVALTTLGTSSKDNESSIAIETSEQISSDPVTLISEIDTIEDSPTTASTSEFTKLEDSTISIEGDTTDSTRVEDEATTLTNESMEVITEEVAPVTNSTNVPETISNIRNNTTNTGRAVDSSTSVPDATDMSVAHSSATIIGSPEATNISITTEVSEFSKVPMIPSTNITSESPSENSTSERSITNATFKSPSSNSTFRISSTKPTTSSPKPDISTIPEETIDIVTDTPIEISSRGGVPSLVKVVFEGSWSDVCPHLDVLRQSLADLLTSGLEKTVLASQVIFQKNPCSGGASAAMMTTELSVTTLLLYVVDEVGNFDDEMTKRLPSLYSKSPIKLQVNIRSFQLVQDSDSGNAIAVVVVSCVALICLILLAGLLFLMRKRQTRFNYGERCRPVSLDAYSLDSVSAYNSVRRKGAARASKRSYGNPTFEDSSAIPSHPLNFAGLSIFCNEQNAISEEFTGIPQVTARIDELPQGAEIKNRYANVVPLPETRVSLMKINNDPLTEYINASYVRGPKNATKYYIACQAPIESTVTDFWRMIWEQQSKVIIMLTDLVENSVEKCAEYVPPSEVTDCHRLFGDFQVTLKKRETKEKYAISTLHLKNLENNTFREISHIWYLWPANGVQSDAAGLIAVLLEARALQRGGPGPIVVHCSPGTGRTGTLIALDLGIRQYEITRTVDVPRVVYTIRRDRAGSVQTKEQYAFIYKALNLYATKLAGGALES